MTGPDREALFAGRGVVRKGLELDPAALAEAFNTLAPGKATPPFNIEQFRGGQSNPTYLLQDAVGRRFVLRRKPPGKLLKSAHAVEREYRVIAALQNTGVAVPRPVFLCESPDAIGTAFYVMEYVEGRIFWNPELGDLQPVDRARVFDAMNETIARLHAIDPVSVGLGDFGKTEGYFARQISRWSGQYQSDEAAGRIAAMDRLIEWLPENIPAEESVAIVHGDYRIDNLIFDPETLEIQAVLDWELSTLGSPISDFAYHCLMYRLGGDMFSGLADRDLAKLGIPTEPEYIAAYCRRTSREGISDFDFYIAFNLFRLAGILHGIAGRVARGTASSKHAAVQAAMAGPMAEAGWTAALRAMNSE